MRRSEIERGFSPQPPQHHVDRGHGVDSAKLCAAYGCFDTGMHLLYMGSRYKQHYLAWATAFHAAVRGRVACIEGDLAHLWHGASEHRRHRERNRRLATFEFDPFADIAPDSNGAWRWSSEKPAMHEYVRSYFASRKEDG